MKTQTLKQKIAKLQRKIGRCYKADHAPNLQTKWNLLRKHKVWIEENKRKQKESDYLRAMNIHTATTALFTPICEILNANKTGGIGHFAVTQDGTEWSIIIHRMGVRNPKTGRIDKRLTPKLDLFIE